MFAPFSTPVVAVDVPVGVVPGAEVVARVVRLATGCVHDTHGAAADRPERI